MPEVRQLLAVPGINLISAVTFMAWVGDIARLPSPRHLVGYLGLDPRVRQSGVGSARYGHISKEGARLVRHVLGFSPLPCREFKFLDRPIPAKTFPSSVSVWMPDSPSPWRACG